MRRLTVRTKCILSGILCCLVLSCADARADARKDLENKLRGIYERKFLSLKTPSAGDRLHFDSQGKVVGAAAARPWSTCGMLQVEKLALAEQRVEITGRRVILALRSTKTALGVIPLVTDRGIRIWIDLPALPSNPPQVNQALSKVFDGGDLLQRVAAYWKPTVDLGSTDPVGQMKVLRDRAPNTIVAELEGGRPVYLVNPGVVDPPKVTYQPDPEYTESARHKRVEGTTIILVVVNEKGFPEILEITKGFDEGLDLRALTAVAGWIFKPAIRNGEPVAVLINVEVAFRLY